MKLKSTMLALSLGLWACTAGAQTIDLGPDAGGSRRFLLYPHLEKGLAAMADGKRRRALVAFEQARLLAPDNPAVTLHLAMAYRHFGAAKYAEALLRRQLTRHPGHAGLTQALQDLGVPAGTNTPAPLTACEAAVKARCKN
jgi:adsorption protein A